MDLSLILNSFLFLLLLPCVYYYYYTRKQPGGQRAPPPPPGPAPWPVVGNLFSLGPKPHKSLAALAATYGPLFTLRLGWRTAVVISSPAVVREVMLHHDAAFSGRSVQDSSTVLGHVEASLVFLPPSSRWRFLRRICTTLVFANSRVDDKRDLRREKVRQVISYTETCSDSNKAINIGQVAFTTMLNILSNTFFSIDMADLSSDHGCEFKQLVWALMVEAGTPNISDFFPFLKAFDLQGSRSRSTALYRKTFKIFGEMIDKKMEMRNKNGHVGHKDVIDSLLTISREEDNDFGRHEILHLLLDLFVAGTDTTSSTIEWALTELIRSPEKLKKAQVELNQVVGKGNPLEESHSSELQYLHAIVKETLRIHPPTPLLVPRSLETNVELSGYTILKNTQVLVNVWAMGRDDKTWENPSLFEPERFLGSTVDYKGHDSELIPFGFGRRICPATQLAGRVMMLVLGSLIHSFDWRLEGEMDMDDKFGITLQKAQPLCLLPILKIR